jgi:hypothetical protein
MLLLEFLPLGKGFILLISNAGTTFQQFEKKIKIHSYLMKKQNIFQTQTSMHKQTHLHAYKRKISKNKFLPKIFLNDKTIRKNNSCSDLKTKEGYMLKKKKIHK